MKNGPALDFESERSISASRFVLLRHSFPDGDARKSHWDLMLEQSESLFTLQLLALPVAECSQDQKIQASRLPDHRRLYLDYEGPVSGERGGVRQVASGTYQLVLCDEAAAPQADTSQGESPKADACQADASQADASQADAPQSGALSQIGRRVALELISNTLISRMQFVISPVHESTELVIEDWRELHH